jgi:hypothetical protein
LHEVEGEAVVVVDQEEHACIVRSREMCIFPSHAERIR